MELETPPNLVGAFYSLNWDSNYQNKKVICWQTGSLSIPRVPANRLIDIAYISMQYLSAETGTIEKIMCKFNLFLF